MNRNDSNKISKNLIYVVAFVLITLVSLFYKLFLSGTFDGFLDLKDEDDPVIIRAEETETSSVVSYADPTTQTSETYNTVSVYICGEVNNPGVYEICSGSIINDVVLLAGGFTEEAQTERINLVYIIESNISIYIPGEDEEYEQSEIVRADGQTIWGEGSAVTGTVTSTGVVNINTATRDQLMTLPGIGEATADAIIEYRQTNPFERIEDIMNVSGIGEAKFNNIRDLICV